MIAMTADSNPMTVKNGAAVPAITPSTATTRKNSAARLNFIGLIGFSVMPEAYRTGATL